jgi:hypothetical protein
MTGYVEWGEVLLSSGIRGSGACDRQERNNLSVILVIAGTGKRCVSRGIGALIAYVQTGSPV